MIVHDRLRQHEEVSLRPQEVKKPSFLLAGSREQRPLLRSPPSALGSRATFPGCLEHGQEVPVSKPADHVLERHQVAVAQRSAHGRAPRRGRMRGRGGRHENSSQALRSVPRTIACAGAGHEGSGRASIASGIGVATPPHRCATERGGVVIRKGPASQAPSTGRGTRWPRGPPRPRRPGRARTTSPAAPRPSRPASRRAP